MAKSLLKNTETIAVVKVSGLTGTTNETITLNTDLLASTQTAPGPFKVWINHLQWSIQGDNGAQKITITRGGTQVIALFDNGNVFDFSGNGGFAETTGEASDLVVSVVGSATVYITLRKAGGYTSKIETAQFGSYDNTTLVGS